MIRSFVDTIFDLTKMFEAKEEQFYLFALIVRRYNYIQSSKMMVTFNCRSPSLRHLEVLTHDVFPLLQVFDYTDPSIFGLSRLFSTRKTT